MFEKGMASIAIMEGEKFAVGPRKAEEIRVTVHIPDNVAENVKRQKINRIYDILNPNTQRR